MIASREDDRLIGQVSRYSEHKVLDWPAVGISIYDERLWGRGLGYEALGLWVDYQLAANPSWHRLSMGTWSGNVGMVRLAAKLGFVEEARYRRARHVRGAWYDSLGFGILREEWAARYPEGFAASLAAWVGRGQVPTDSAARQDGCLRQATCAHPGIMATVKTPAQPTLPPRPPRARPPGAARANAELPAGVSLWQIRLDPTAA